MRTCRHHGVSVCPSEGTGYQISLICTLPPESKEVESDWPALMLAAVGGVMSPSAIAFLLVRLMV